MNVVFIQKSGRDGHKPTNNFRRVLEIHLRTIMNKSPFSKFQHACLKSKSTEAVLHEIITTRAIKKDGILRARIMKLIWKVTS